MVHATIKNKYFHMKKIGFYSTFCLIFFTSCKKEYVCSCHTNTQILYYDADDNFIDETNIGSAVTTTVEAKRKKTAISICEGLNSAPSSTYTNDTGSYGAGLKEKVTMNTDCILNY